MTSQVVVLLVLVLMNAFFAGSELALISLNKSKLKNQAEEGNRKAAALYRLKDSPNSFLSTIQIGVSVASILSGIFASEAFAENLSSYILRVSNLSAGVVKPVSILIITLLTSYVMLLFGELVPKRIAMDNPEKFSFAVVYPIVFLSKISKPIVKFLSLSTNFCLRILGIDPHKTDDEVSEEEIRIMVDAGEIDMSEKEMINNIFEFDNKEVSDIMTHRTEVISVDINSSFEEILDLVYQERYTRYPVYEENLDNIIGIIHLRDLLRYIRNKNQQAFNLKDLLLDVYFIPESKRTDQLFRELQIQKAHMAVVVDEYGGTAGIVTMEDLIEEVMGNILDEYDDEEELYDIIPLSPGEYLVDGACELDELEDLIAINLPIDDYDTVSGFVIGVLGRIPMEDDIQNPDSEISFKNYKFTILSIDEKVVSKIRVSKLEEVKED